jgi:hypothetical protein
MFLVIDTHRIVQHEEQLSFTGFLLTETAVGWLHCYNCSFKMCLHAHNVFHHLGECAGEQDRSVERGQVDLPFLENG